MCVVSCCCKAMKIQYVLMSGHYRNHMLFGSAWPKWHYVYQMIFSIHFSPFVFCAALKITANIRTWSTKEVGLCFFFIYALFDRKDACQYTYMWSSIEYRGYRHSWVTWLCQPKTEYRNQQRCHIRAEITINLRPFLILNWVIERFSPVLSHQLLSNPDVITVQ